MSHSHSCLSQQVHPRSAAVTTQGDDADMDLEGEDNNDIDDEGEEDKALPTMSHGVVTTFCAAARQGPHQ